MGAVGEVAPRAHLQQGQRGAVENGAAHEVEKEREFAAREFLVERVLRQARREQSLQPLGVCGLVCIPRPCPCLCLCHHHLCLGLYLGSVVCGLIAHHRQRDIRELH